jgi:hypothetical protein
LNARATKRPGVSPWPLVVVVRLALVGGAAYLPPNPNQRRRGGSPSLT